MTILRGKIATAVAGGRALPVLLLLLGAVVRLAWVVLFAPHGFADGING